MGARRGSAKHGQLGDARHPPADMELTDGKAIVASEAGSDVNVAAEPPATVGGGAITRRAPAAAPADAAGASHGPASIRGVSNIAERLFERYDPTVPSSARSALRLEVQHYYAPSVLRPIDWYVNEVFNHGARLFLQGKCSGVGATTLACDFARAFNYRAGVRGDLRRVLYARFESGTNTIPKFYDTLGLCFRAPLTTTEVRFRSPLYFALRVLTGAAMHGATAIILDHLSETPPKVRAGVAALLQLTDPNFVVSADLGAFVQEVRTRIGVMIVDRVPPQRLFRESPRALLLLENRHQVLRPYQTVEEIGEAMRQAGIGLDDLELAVATDHEMAEMVLQKTQGLPAQITPLLGLISTVAHANGARRPTPALIAQALPFHRSLVDVISVPVTADDVAGERLYGVYASEAPQLPERLTERQRRRMMSLGAQAELEPVDGGESQSVRRKQSPSRGTRSQHLRARREQRDVAKAEGAAMTRKQHLNVDFGDRE